MIDLIGLSKWSQWALFVDDAAAELSVFRSSDPVVVESLAAPDNAAADPAAGQRVAAFYDLLRLHLPIAEEPGDLLCHFIRQVAKEHVASLIIKDIPVRMIVSM